MIIGGGQHCAIRQFRDFVAVKAGAGIAGKAARVQGMVQAGIGEADIARHSQFLAVWRSINRAAQYHRSQLHAVAGTKRGQAGCKHGFHHIAQGFGLRCAG